MFGRLLDRGYIDMTDLPLNSHWQARCFGRLARGLTSEHYFTFGIKIIPPNYISWPVQATLVLAACKQGLDCALGNFGDEWVLWSHYSNELDDQKLTSSIQLQLALIHYLERDMLKTAPANKPRIWRREL